MPESLQLGRIVWAEVADARGYRKMRPAVIFTPTDDIDSSGLLDVVAVTSRVPDPLPADHVLLPWQVQGHSRTGLNRKCSAVCTWVVRIRSNDVKGVAGVLPGTIILNILEKIAASD